MSGAKPGGHRPTPAGFTSCPDAEFPASATTIARHMMKLYSYWRSTAAYRVRIALNLKGIEHDTESVNLTQQVQTSEGYLAINPQALVPSLTLDEATLTQSSAIIEYLEERYPEPPLLPSGVVEKARVRSFCQAIACDIHPLNNLRVLRYLRSELGVDAYSVKQWYGTWVSKGFEALEGGVQATCGRYCFGDSVTMADVFLVPQMFNARRFECDVTPYPNLRGIVSRLERHPAFVDAAPARQPDATNDLIGR